MLYNIIMILLSILIPIIIIKEPLKEIINKENIKVVIKNNKYDIITYLLIVLGCLVRSVGINLYPIGLNVDEASSAYEAFSILNFGIDRNENSFPVFLEAWGSGQNALYSYIMIPFIKLFGLNIISTRLPMALIGCFSLFIWYKLLNKIVNKKFAIIGLAFFVICPWHIMKSRWGLESNIFPDIVLYALFLITKFLESKKNRYFYIACILLGLTAYAYGTAYFFLPFFVIPLLVYLKYKKEISLSKILIGITIVGVISMPIILYIIINTFNLQELKIGIFTVPKLPVNRYEEQTSLFSGNLFNNIIKNFINSIKILVLQNDKLSWNCIPGFGMFYVLSLPFTIIGLIYNLKNKNKYKNLFNLWFIAAFLLLFVLTETNINRINILIMPLVYYTVLGIYLIIQNYKKSFFAIAIVYSVLFICFECNYYLEKKENYVFVNNIEQIIKYVDSLDVDDIYMEYTFKEPYIYVLYYTQANPYEFINTVKYFDDVNLGRFDNIKEFGKWHFYIPDKIETTKKVAYVIKKDSQQNLKENDYIVKELNQYIILYNGVKEDVK